MKITIRLLCYDLNIQRIRSRLGLMLFKIHLVPSYLNNNLKLRNEFYLYPLIIPSLVLGF